MRMTTRRAALALASGAGICQMFEQRLKKTKPHERKITYDISDLFDFIDTMPDMSILTYVGGISCC